MTDQTEPTSLNDTSCFTYSVSMVVQILAPNEEIAREKLDRDGGYVSKREVNLIDTVHLYTGEDKEKEKSE